MDRGYTDTETDTHLVVLIFVRTIMSIDPKSCLRVHMYTHTHTHTHTQTASHQFEKVNSIHNSPVTFERYIVM